MRTRSRVYSRLGLLIAFGVLSSFIARSIFYGQTLRSKASSGAKLVSVVPLPEEGEWCEAQPAGPPLIAALQQEQNPGRASSNGNRDRRLDPAKLKPIRMIQDPYAALSAVAVDVAHNEVIMTDENLFQLLVYDRQANTPPSAILTEPKRRLAGDKTDIEFQCGLYIDPKTGDIYAPNNDTVDRLVIFNREANGNVPPARELHTPHGTFGLAMDEGREEMYLAIQHDNAIVVYPKYAQNEDKPIRLIQGDHTLLADPHGIAVDTKNDLIFVTNYGSTATKQKGRGPEVPNWPLEDAVPGSGRFLPPSITVYRRDARGDATPVRVIQGPKTRLNWATGITLDPDRNELLVANDVGNDVLIFDVAAQGDAAPKRVLGGAKTLIKNPTGLYLDLKNDELWVTNFGNHSATVYKRGADGDTAPLRVIRTGPIGAPAPMMGNPHPIAYDTKRDEILVPN
jgi:DNA-binding beta-propeller fold protein YncE